MNRITCLLIFVGLTPGIAQTTWGGLKFGMTPTEVKTALKGKQIEESVESKNEYRPEWLILTVKDIAVDRHKGEARLIFPGPERKLKRVALWFSRVDEGTGCFDVPKDEVLPRISLIEDISQRLVERYGKPVSETGSIPTRDELIKIYVYKAVSVKIDVKRIWKADGQIIEQWLIMPCGTVFLSISYSPEPKSEL